MGIRAAVRVPSLRQAKGTCIPCGWTTVRGMATYTSEPLAVRLTHSSLDIFSPSQRVGVARPVPGLPIPAVETLGDNRTLESAGPRHDRADNGAATEGSLLDPPLCSLLH